MQRLAVVAADHHDREIDPLAAGQQILRRLRPVVEVVAHQPRIGLGLAQDRDFGPVDKGVGQALRQRLPKAVADDGDEKRRRDGRSLRFRRPAGARPRRIRLPLMISRPRLLPRPGTRGASGRDSLGRFCFMTWLGSGAGWNRWVNQPKGPSCAKAAGALRKAASRAMAAKPSRRRPANRTLFGAA